MPRDGEFTTERVVTIISQAISEVVTAEWLAELTVTILRRLLDEGVLTLGPTDAAPSSEGRGG